MHAQIRFVIFFQKQIWSKYVNIWTAVWESPDSPRVHAFLSNVFLQTPSLLKAHCQVCSKWNTFIQENILSNVKHKRYLHNILNNKLKSLQVPKWGRNDEGWWGWLWWRMKISSCWVVLLYDWLTNEQKFVIVESFLRLKRQKVLKVMISWAKDQ